MSVVLVPTLSSLGLDFTVYDLFIDSGGSTVGHLLHEDSDVKSSTATNPLRAEKQDVGTSPFEQRPEFGDPFAQGDFSHGEGQFYYHHEGRDARKYLASEGFDISDPSFLKHLRATDTALSSSSVGSITQANDVLLLANGASVLVGDGTFPGDWTTEDPHVAEGSTDVLDIASRGDEVFAALGANGVHIRSSSGTWSHFQPDDATDLVTGTTTRVAWLKDRLLVAGTGGREIFEVVADSTPTAIKTLPEGWTFEGIFEAGAYIYATAVNADAGQSRVHILGLNNDATAIEDKGSVPAPRGELLYAGIGTVGQVFLGGGRKNVDGGYDPVFYQAVQREEDGFLQFAKIQQGEGAGDTDCSVKAFEDLGDAIVFSWSLGSEALVGARAGLAWYHLGRQAFAMHLKASSTARIVQDVIYYHGRLIVSVENDGLYYERSNVLVPEAYLISSAADWNSAGLKIWDNVELAYKPLPASASVEIQYATDLPEANTEWTSIVTGATPESAGVTERIQSVSSRYFAVKLISTATTDESDAPEIQSYSIRSNPTRTSPEFVLTRFVRLLAKDRKDERAPEVFKNPSAVRLEMQALLDTWVTVNEPGITWTAFVRNVSDAKPAEPFISATSGEPLKEGYLVRLDMVATGEAA